jgi:type III secretion protein J
VAAGLLVAACTTEVQHGLGEGEANRLLVALQRAGIPAEKLAEPGQGGGQRGGYAVRVRSSDATRAFATLSELDLPKSPPRGFAEVFGGDGLVPSAVEERARLLDALAGELVRTLRAVDGVVEARVHLGLSGTGEDPGSLEAEPLRSLRASVLLKVAAAEFTPPIRPPDVQRLVAGAVQGLDPGQVQVVYVRARPGSSADRGEQQRILRLRRAAWIGFSGLGVAGVALLWLLGKLVRLRRALDIGPPLPPPGLPREPRFDAGASD